MRLDNHDTAELTRRDFLHRIIAGTAALTAGGGAVAAPAGAAEPESPLRRRVRRWGMVIDLRRCDGCVGLDLPPQCTQFCIWDRYVPEGQQWIEVHENTTADLPGAGEGFMPMLCMQCENAPCVSVCPVAATFHTEEGTVLIDQQRCIGCRLCMAACPYDRNFFNADQPVQPDWIAAAPYDVQTQIPAMAGTVMKCDFCPDKAAAGGLPSCVLGCPRGALYYGDLEEDIATNGLEIDSFSNLLGEAAFRHRDELGTRPRVFYIPGHGQHARAESDNRRLLTDQLEWPWLDWALADAERAGGA
jgi:dimethyl sulfoxide reductase iron-sulfur subunit